jgi:hypothetical protein
MHGNHSPQNRQTRPSQQHKNIRILNPENKNKPKTNYSTLMRAIKSKTKENSGEPRLETRETRPV